MVDPGWEAGRVVTIDDVRAVAAPLPRSYEVLVRDRVKFRVGRLVYLAFSRDETLMGFAFPKDEREALVASDPGKFLMPLPSDLRYHWVRARLDALDPVEMSEIVVDAWRMVVPKKVAAEHRGQPDPARPVRAAPPVAAPGSVRVRRAGVWPGPAGRR
jgi:hypothetical protein